MKVPYLKQRIENLRDDMLKEVENLEEQSELINARHIISKSVNDLTRQVMSAIDEKANKKAVDKLLKK